MPKSLMENKVKDMLNYPPASPVYLSHIFYNQLLYPSFITEHQELGYILNETMPVCQNKQDVQYLSW